MACCECCCGGETCAEGQEGKCCCGGSSGECCQPTEFCCSGECSPEPCEQLAVVITPARRYAGDCFTVTVTAPAGDGALLAVSLTLDSQATASDFDFFPSFVSLPASSSSRTKMFQVCPRYDCASHSGKTFAVTASSSGLGPATSNTATILFRISPLPSLGSWSGTDSLAEGTSGTQTLALSAPNARMCAWLYNLSIVHDSTSPADVSLSQSSATVTPAGDPSYGAITVSFTAAADSFYEGVESFRIRATRGSSSFTSGYISITDASAPATYSITPNVTSIQEGQCVTFSVTTTNLQNGTVLTWSVNHLSTSDSDFPSSSLSGSVTINNNAGSFSVCAYNDTDPEPPEAFSVILRHSGVVKAESVPVTIRASDQQCPTFDASVSRYVLDLSAGCAGSWFDEVSLNCLFVAGDSSYRNYDSDWQTMKVIPNWQPSGGRTLTHYVRGTVSTDAYGEANSIGVQVRADYEIAGYTTIFFTVDCADGRFPVTLTSGDPKSNPAKQEAGQIRWSDGDCTSDYDVYVGWSVPPAPYSLAPSPEGGGASPGGPGAELKSMLAKVGIKATEGCVCNKRAKAMDERGVEWCENNIDTIVGWLSEEAKRRGLPFIDMVGRMLVKRAIKKAKRDSKK